MKKLLIILIAIPSIVLGQNQFIKIKDNCSIFWELEKDPSISFEWSGLCKNGKANGKGILKRLKKYPNIEPILHSTIECTMLDGKIDGNAKMEWINSIFFKTLQGVWHKGVITTGKLTFYSQQHDGKKTYIYDGELKKLYQKNGNGRVTDENNIVIQEGEFKDDIFVKGNYIYPTASGLFDSNPTKIDSLQIKSLGKISIDQNEQNITKYVASPKGNLFSIATKDDIIYIYSIEKQELLYTITDLYEKKIDQAARSNSISSGWNEINRLANPFPNFEFSPNEKYFYAYDGEIAYIFDIEKGNLFFQKELYLHPLNTKISFDETKILQLYNNGFRTSQIFPSDLTKISKIKEFLYAPNIKSIKRFISSKSFNHSAVTTGENYYNIYNNKNGKKINSINVGNLESCFISDKYFLSIGIIAGCNVISIFNLEKNSKIGEIHPFFFNQKVFSNFITEISDDDKYLIFSSKNPENNGYIEFYDLEKLKCVLRIKNDNLTSFHLNYEKNEIIYSEGTKIFSIKLPFKINSNAKENNTFWSNY